MINIGNKEITSIYSGKNAVNGIYCGQKLIWPTTPPTPPIEKVYFNMLYVDDMSYEYNPSEKTYDSPTTYKTVGIDFYKRRLIVEDTEAEWKRVISEVIDCEIIQDGNKYTVVNRGMSKNPFGPEFRIYNAEFLSEDFDTYEEAESLLEEITRTGSIEWIGYTRYGNYWTIEMETPEYIFCGRDWQHMKIFKDQIYPQWSATPPPPTKKHYLVSFQSEYEDASYDLENPDGGTPDNEFFQEVYESTSDDKIFIAKAVKEFDPDSYEIIDWKYSADTRHIADDEIQVVVPVTAYGEMEDVGDCWFRSEVYRTFDNQVDADDYVNYIQQNGIDDFTDFEMSNAKDIVYDDTEPYTEFPYIRSVWPPSDPSVDTQNWITEVYDELPKYAEHKVFKKEWLTGTITDSQGQEFDAVFSKMGDFSDYIGFNLTSLNGQPIDRNSPLYFELFKQGIENWKCSMYVNSMFVGSLLTAISDREAKQFNITISIQGMTIQFNLRRTGKDPTIQ